MLKAATYARYSTDMQSERSIEDQLRICSQFALKEGLDIAAQFDDRAITGAVSNRPGYQDMLTAARRGEFQVLLVDELSRLGRSDTEVGRARDEFEFLQIRLVAVGDGIDTKNKGSKPLIGLKSMVNAMFIETVAHETHRSLAGKAMRGKVAGGRIYGYRNVPIEDPTQKDPYGRPKIIDVEREVNPEQAAWVQQIFEWYGEDIYTMQQIAYELNRRGVESPHKRKWSHTGIRDLLLNQIYIGQYIWNRTKKLKNKETGARKYIAKPRDEWIVKAMPALRIIQDEVWQKVQDKFAARAAKNAALRASGRGGNYAANPKYVFSGLLKCGDCGANFVLVNHYMYGCGAHKSKGAAVCPNGERVPRQVVERRLLHGLKEELGRNEVFELFKQRVIEHSANMEDRADIAPLRQRMKQLDVEIARMLDAIKAGMMGPSIKQAMMEAEREKSCLERELKAIEAQKSVNVVQLIPALKTNFEKMILDLENVLNKDTIKSQALLKALIGESVMLYRKDDHLEAEIKNQLPVVLRQAIGFTDRMRWCPELDVSAFYTRISLKYNKGGK